MCNLDSCTLGCRILSHRTNEDLTRFHARGFHSITMICAMLRSD